MRAALTVTVVAVALALGACGGDDEPDKAPTVTTPGKQPTEDGVSAAIRDYLNAFTAGEGRRACRLLDENGQASVVSFLPSDNRAIACEVAVRRVSRQVVPLRRFEIEKVSVSGRSATAQVRATDRQYESGVLLSNRGDGWKISFPPGLQAKSGRPPPKAVPGVPLERDNPY